MACSFRIPGVRIVATSREPLNVAGERVWPLDPLDVPPAERLVRRDPDLGVRRPVHLPPAGERGDPHVECRRRRRCRDDLSHPGGHGRSPSSSPRLAPARCRCPTWPTGSATRSASWRFPAMARCPVTARCGSALAWGYRPVVAGRPDGAPSDERVRRWLRPAGIRRRVCRRRRSGARCPGRARAYIVRPGRRDGQPGPLPAARADPSVRRELLDASGEHGDRQTTAS